MSLTNRVSSVANKRLIKELDSNGNVVNSYYAIVERADGASQGGTALTAENLQAEIVSLINQNTPSSIVATTQCECDCSTNVATTAFVWNVLTALGLTRISHNHTNYEGGGSSGSDNDET